MECGLPLQNGGCQWHQTMAPRTGKPGQFLNALGTNFYELLLLLERPYNSDRPKKTPPGSVLHHITMDTSHGLQSIA